MGKKSRRARRSAQAGPAARPERLHVAPPPAVHAPRRPVKLEGVVRNKLLLLSVALAIVVGLVYLPALEGQFINWDDPNYVTNNPNIRGLTGKTIVWAFTTFKFANWHPLTWMSLALDYQLYGLRPYGYHLTSLLLHVANCVLVLLVLHRLTGALWRSAAVAVLFGVHPLHVESVAWVAERKDVLCGLFWLLTMAAYTRYVRRRTRVSYVAVLLGFTMALLAKPMALTLPAALLLLDYWPMRRLSRQALWEKLPLLGLAVAVSVLTFVAQRAGGAVAIDPIPFGARVSNAIVAYVRYIALTLWPTDLSPWYSHPALEGPPLSGWVLASAAGLLVAVTGLVIWLAPRAPYLPFGWFWYLGTFVPVIGLIQVGRQGMADRYTYIPHVGLFVALVWGIAALPIWKVPRARVAAAVAAALVVLGLGMLTVRQTRIWHDSTTFWTYTARSSPHSFIAHQALGNLLLGAGRLDEALIEYQHAVRLRPDFPDVRSWLGYLLARKGKLEDAAAQYRKAVALRPDSADDHNSLAAVLIDQGQMSEAQPHLERALALRPGLAEAHNNLGRLRLAEGRHDEAVAEFQAALQAKPGLGAARRNLNEVLARRKRVGTVVGE